MASRGGYTDRTLHMGGASSGGGTTTTRPSMAPPQVSGSVVKSRQLAHLHSQLAQLSANLADTENLLRMTSVQAGAMRGLGSWHAALRPKRRRKSVLAAELLVFRGGNWEDTDLTDGQYH
ncbi:DASH complex subunit Hsk3 like-domain-containing protein [Xylariaceae sp. FL0594]|nr:DASH complex subunit Hsk3 like-domain-containing protein [Xylariaceae sp. FL0594]